MAIYESDKLAELVYRLCDKLQRPVSSKDLLHFFRDDPNSRPLLLQRPGQLLFKLSKPKRRLPSRIHRIGVISNLAFYAPSAHEGWVLAFHAYSDAFRLNEQVHFQMPEHVSRLMGSRFELFARNALAGFVREFEPVYCRCQSYHAEVTGSFLTMLQMAKRHAASQFEAVVPETLISREKAADMLRQGYAHRMPMSNPESMSVGRHLVHLRWPQCPLFGDLTEMFWENQVAAYCSSRWPVNGAERTLGKGLSLAMRYGQGVASCSKAATTSAGLGTLA